MSQERVKLNFGRIAGNTPVRDHDDTQVVREQDVLQPEAIEEMRRKKLVDDAERGILKAKLAVVLDRGIVQDRLQVDLPPDVYGEWVRNDPMEIRRAETLGFKVDDTFASARKLHSDGANGSIVGDVIFMTCDRAVHEVIKEIRHDKLIEQHSKKRSRSGDLNKEEADYMKSAGEFATISSSEKSANYEHIRQTLAAIDNQVKPAI